jgi:superfamily II DNA/RNA helicase
MHDGGFDQDLAFLIKLFYNVRLAFFSPFLPFKAVQFLDINHFTLVGNCPSTFTGEVLKLLWFIVTGIKSFFVNCEEKLDVLFDLLEDLQVLQGVIFVNERDTAEVLHQHLKMRNISSHLVVNFSPGTSRLLVGNLLEQANF